MQAIHADNVNWKSRGRGVREAKIYSSISGSDETRIDIVEVPAGGYVPPHRHSSRREFITILTSAGAQLQIGERVFRPVAGQVFHREPEDVMALTNDSHHPFRFSVVSFGYDKSDIEWLNEKDAEEESALERVEGFEHPGQASTKAEESESVEESTEVEAESEEAEPEPEAQESTSEDEAEKSEDDKSEKKSGKKGKKSKSGGKSGKKKGKKK